MITGLNEKLAGVNLDFLGLGLSPAALLGIYLLVLVIVVVLIVVIAKKAGGGKGPAALIKRWGKQPPSADELLVGWEQLDAEAKEQVGALSREHGWCSAYLKTCGKNENAARAILTLWPYQAEKKDDLLKAIIEEIADLHIEQNMAATALLKEINDERVVPFLLLALLQTDKYPPARICDALTAFGTVSARALVALYHKLSAEQIRERCLILDALGELRALCPREILQVAMADPELEIRRKAAEVIALVRPEPVIDFIEPLLTAAEGKVRAAAAAALSEIGGEQVYLKLREVAAQDEDWQVKSTCQVFITRWEEDIREHVTLDEADLWLKDSGSAAAGSRSAE